MEIEQMLLSFVNFMAFSLSHIVINFVVSYIYRII